MTSGRTKAKSIATTVSGKARAAEAKVAFEAAFGHDGDDHNPNSTRNVYRRTLCGKSDCGWWWCGASLVRSQWVDLRRALDVLRDNNLDPKGLDILHLVSPWRTAEQLAPEEKDLRFVPRDTLNEFDSAARKVLSVLWPNGATKIGPKKYELVAVGERWVPIEVKDDPYALLTATIRRFEPLVAAANAARPVGQDPRVKNGPRATLAKARELSRESQPARGKGEYRVPARPAKTWTNEAVAAALIMTGVERDDFDALVIRLGKMRSRQPKSPK